jgi:hypothetical protein
VRPVATDPDRRAGLLHGRRQQRDVVDREVPALVVDRLAGPVASQQVEPLVQPLGEDDRVGRLAEAAVLVVYGTAQTGAEHDPPVAERVERRDLTGEVLRAAPWHRRDQRSDRDPRRGESGGGQQHPRVAERLAGAQRLVVHDVVPDEEAVPARLLDGDREPCHQLGVGEVAEVRDVDREPHARILP